MSNYRELVADLRALAVWRGSPAVEANSAAFNRAADAIETLLAQLEAERESLRLAADEGLRNLGESFNE